VLVTEPVPGGVVVERLVEVPLREVWADEASLFTPWLAAHPEYLSEALGMELDLVGTEVAVGPFSADIVLVDSGSGGRVIVENYLEATDHDHLGKLITYASGLEGSYAVLVAKTLRPEHRTALKWLNDISISGTGFFGLEVHAVRIGESLPALRLEVIVEPDDWQRQVRQIATGQLSESQARYIEWWSEFLAALQIAHPGWTSASKPQPISWINLPTGRSGVRYGVSFSWPGGPRSYRLRVELYMVDGAMWWPILEAHKSAIDDALGPDLVWEPLEDSKASRIAVYLDGVDPDDRGAWPAYRSWAIDKVAQFRAALQPIVTTAVTMSPPTAPAELAEPSSAPLT
jgi:Domain of unknown function (DUF4268)